MSDINDGPIFIDVDDDEPAEICLDFADNSDQLNSDDKKKESISDIKNYKDVFLNAPHRFRCNECNRYTAETEEKIQRHIKKVHRGENPFQCSMCDYSTYNNTVFEEHSRVHQGIKPYKCSKCPYRSVSKKNTKKHELIHRPNNPLKCNHCDFIARHSRSLLNHLKKHNIVNEDIQMYKEDSRSKKQSYVRKRYQEDEFSCGICAWSSRNKPKILLHIIHHPNQYIDESVIDVSILKKHGILK